MALTGKEILIIDDTADVRLLSRKIVENAGMIVSEADSVDQALEILEKKTPHVILLDLRMPGKSGFSFLSQRQLLPALKIIPIIVISGASDRDSIHRARALGAEEYVLKPFGTSMLMQKIRKVLKDQEFKSYRFPENDILPVSINVPAEISKISETGFFIESQVKLGGAVNLKLRSEQLVQLQMDSCIFISNENAGVRGSNGAYFSQVRVVGLRSTIPLNARKVGIK